MLNESDEKISGFFLIDLGSFVVHLKDAMIITSPFYTSHFTKVIKATGCFENKAVRH